MSSSGGTEWRFVIIEDDETIARQLSEACPTFVQAPDTATSEVYKDFKSAKEGLDSLRYDFAIVDLKDDKSSILGTEELPGLEIYEHIKKQRFAAVVFYTALPKRVLPEETAFVHVVEKTDGISAVGEKIKNIFETGLPSIIRIIDEAQREYMWDFVHKNWASFKSAHEQSDLAYLLARRLAMTLEGKARKLVHPIAGKGIPVADPHKAHPMELYIFPPLAENHSAGEIVTEKVGGDGVFWVVLTPSCDFEQKDRIERVLLGRCHHLTDQPEYQKWATDEKAGEELASLKALIADGRLDVQSERFKYLPGTFFMPDLIVDFQMLKAVTKEELSALVVVAHLDSPYAEALLSRFSRYFGRLGTTDLDKTVVIDRLKAGLPRNSSDPGSSTPSENVR